MPEARRPSRATRATSTRRLPSAGGNKTFVRDVRVYFKQYLGDSRAVPPAVIFVPPDPLFGATAAWLQRYGVKVLPRRLPVTAARQACR
jgi:hypothetical protein